MHELSVANGIVEICAGRAGMGFLFGLGFDTATEIGLLGIAAAEAAHGLPSWQIPVLPTLFTAGMALVDTADSALMVGAYGWACNRGRFPGDQAGVAAWRTRSGSGGMLTAPGTCSRSPR